MLFNYLIGAGQQRPSILEANKDEKYHCDFARYFLGESSSYQQQKFLEKIYTNKRFYKGDQWINEEDIESFLKDEDNSERNRLAIVLNQIRPMVEQYRGNAIRMNINYRAKSISPQAINRREAALSKTLFMSRMANRPDNPFGEKMKKEFPIGDTESETRAQFENAYQDDYVKNMNYLMKFVSERCDFVDKQITVALQLCFSGLSVIKSFEYGGHQEFEEIQSERFIFDRSAKRPDLSDGEYQGDYDELTPQEIFEEAPNLNSDERKAIDDYAKFYSSTQQKIDAACGKIYNGRVPVFTMYWKDGQTDEFGYVKDEAGYEYFARINYIYEGDDKPRYTDKDLIKSNTERAKKILGDKLKAKVYYDVLRTCRFIPKEILASATTSTPRVENFKDIVLEWGISTYQETEVGEFNSVNFPYKCQTWAYVDGEILSPLDDAIDPQRFINRLWSVSENQINNSRGSGMVYDGDLVEDESEMLRNMNQSKPVKVNARGKSVQNAIGTYDATIRGGTETIFRLIDSTINSIKNTTGINDALKGESTGSDQLVGVTELQIERGSLMQEAFYYAITNMFKQCFKAICTQGKRIYADNPRNMAIAVGDEGVQIITITKEMKTEDFRVFIKRSNSDEMLVSQANQELLALLNNPTGPLIDQKRFAGLWGRSTPEEVATAMRAYANEKEEIQRQAQKQAQQQEAMLQEQAQQEQMQQAELTDEMIARQDMKDITDKLHDEKMESIKSLSKVAPKNKKAENMIVQNAKKFENLNI